MPKVVDKNRITNEDTLVYKRPCTSSDNPDQVEFLLKWRKETASLHQEMLNNLKFCGMNKDKEGIVFFREEANYHRKLYNALLFVIPWYCVTPPGDCKKIIEPWYFPLDLSDQFDLIYRSLSVR